MIWLFTIYNSFILNEYNINMFDIYLENFIVESKVHFIFYSDTAKRIRVTKWDCVHHISTMRSQCNRVPKMQQNRCARNAIVFE